MLIKLNFQIFVLGCLFVLSTTVMAGDLADTDQSEQLTGLHTAKVIVPKAIVYSDEVMSSPLGYITIDKQITVGNPRKRNPELLPMVVYGRVAFIEAKNIHFESEVIETQNTKRGAHSEHNIDIILTKPEEKLSENNAAYMSLHFISAGQEMKDVVTTVDGSSTNHFTGFEISLLHRQATARPFWGAGYQYNNLTTPNVKFVFYMLNPTVGYTPIKNSLFLFDLLLSLDFSLSTLIKIESINQKSGFVWGPQVAARIVFFPTLNYHAFGTLGYRNYKVVGVKSFVRNNDDTIPGVTKINNLSFSLGFAFEI